MLKIGQIDFANLYPIFYGLSRNLQAPNYQFIKGHPSKINHLIGSGEIDTGPCSSIEYLRHADKYNLIPGHSISAFGEIKSILLFSKSPITELSNHCILTSYKSETSSALLRIILEKFLNLKVDISISGVSLKDGLSSNTAYLLIGDDAISEACINGFMDCEGRINYKSVNGLYLYDLSMLWYEYTGLPFVFALWISTKEAELKDEYQGFIRQLDIAKADAALKMPEIAQSYSSKGNLRAVLSVGGYSPPNPGRLFTEALLLSYWNTISYDMTELHLKGLERFRELL